MESGQRTQGSLNGQGGESEEDKINRNEPELSLVALESPLVLSWKDVSVKAKRGKKIILDSVSGSVSGGFWAIMGASGSGKTTLLSTLSLRLIGQVTIEGDVTLNGREYDKNTLKSVSAYVMQDDLLHPELTIQETLHFTAQLRLPKEISHQEACQRIEAVIQLMGLEGCKGVIVGDSRKKGISGGERKRLCIAMELLSKPALLFLDEPTSGLDSSTALDVCQALRDLTTKSHCTVISTIHQPQHKIFTLFNHLILMKKGRIVYQGEAQKSLLFLEAVGMPCPIGVNPADHLLTVVADKKGNSNVEESIVEVAVDLTSGLEKPDFEPRKLKNWFVQVSILLKRDFQQHFRRWDVLVMNVVAAVVISLFVSLGIWHNIGTTQSSIPLRAPSLFFAAISQGLCASFQGTHTFPLERALMLRERAAGTYYVSAYFVSKSISDMTVQLVTPIIYSCIVYPAIGYQPHADKFFIFMAFMILATMAATSLATMLSCVCLSIQRTTVMMSFCFEICRLYGGWFISPKLMRTFPQWHFADALSYIKYAFVGVAINELSGLKLTCTKSQLNALGKCPTTRGEQLMIAAGYNYTTIGSNVGWLIFYIFVCRFLSYIALRFIRR